eukprot:7459110-Alexandrium_andersonii.AAC.1
MPLPDDPAAKKALFYEALIGSERARLAQYKLAASDEAFDLAQNPLKRPLRSKGGVLHTLISSMGIIWLDGMDRFMSCRELAVAMGYPCTAASESATGGASCSYSPRNETPPQRTRSTMAAQLGNAMHVNVMGSFELTLLIFLPLGRLYSDEEVKEAGAIESGFARAFREAQRGVKRPWE